MPEPEPAAALDLAAAIGDLDRATRNFSRRFGEPPEVDPATRPPRPSAAADEAFEARMLAAEREAREYLERAKERADSLVVSMVGAVEREAAAMRRDAEEGIRARWQHAEAEAQRHLERARRVGDAMVAERQQRLAALGDGIAGRAEALTAGLEDADRVRAQFTTFIRALSATADRIAAESTRSARGALPISPLRERSAPPGPGALAA